ncbi:MAG: type II toxin-antitoxin system Phd/YefM family antitoxin [Clostridiales bacterium]|nr:type II toxin-antitoxin system Phd/YefM family antitoxin [Candidatus Cacconaster stercorequi]
MKISPSSALRNNYTQISERAKVSGDPFFITNKGEDDGVFMSMAAYEDREKMYRHGYCTIWWPGMYRLS